MSEKKHKAGKVPHNALQVPVQADAPVTGPPVKAFRTDDHQTVYEELVLVGVIYAPRDARQQLDLYGIDMRYSEVDGIFEDHWRRCMFSLQVADMLVELAAEKEFPYAFRAVPSWAELDWRVRQARGETTRPIQSLYLYVEPASDEAIAAYEKRTGERLVWEGRLDLLAPEQEGGAS